MYAENPIYIKSHTFNNLYFFPPVYISRGVLHIICSQNFLLPLDTVHMSVLPICKSVTSQVTTTRIFCSNIGRTLSIFIASVYIQVGANYKLLILKIFSCPRLQCPCQRSMLPMCIIRHKPSSWHNNIPRCSNTACSYVKINQ